MYCKPIEFYIHIYLCVRLYARMRISITVRIEPSSCFLFFWMKDNWRVDVTSQKISFFSFFLSLYSSFDFTWHIQHSSFLSNDSSCMWVSVSKQNQNHHHHPASSFFDIYTHTPYQIDVPTCHFNFFFNSNKISTHQNPWRISRLIDYDVDFRSSKRSSKIM